MVLDSQIINLGKGVEIMTEKRLIQGTYSTRRYLHSDEVFRKERNWNINLPSEREFKNGYCIVTDKEDTAYSIDELVNLLNELHEENQQLKVLTIPVQDTLIEEFTITKEDISNNQRITELTNYALTEFIKSKGYTLKEVNQFIKEEL